MTMFNNVQGGSLDTRTGVVNGAGKKVGTSAGETAKFTGDALTLSLGKEEDLVPEGNKQAGAQRPVWARPLTRDRKKGTTSLSSGQEADRSKDRRQEKAAPVAANEGFKPYPNSTIVVEPL